MMNWKSLSLLFALVAVSGCTKTEPPVQDKPALMEANEHEHYHVHGADVSHEHSHEDEKHTGHEHEHLHEDDEPTNTE